MMWFYVWIGWFFGAVARFFLTKYWNYILPHNVPFGTLLVNLCGSLLMWIIFGIFFFQEIDVRIKSLVVTWFLWALTTFSTFSLESFFLLDSWEYKHFFYNVFGNVCGTILFAALWFYGAKILIWHLVK